MRALSLPDLVRFAVRRSLFTASDLQQAIDRFGFIQADPIRAPARAQDLILRQRVPHYRAGDLEREYEALRVEEDFFVNYGFLAPDIQALMHPRGAATWTMARRRRTEAVLAFVRERGAVHPREVEQQFTLGRVTNYWGGSSNATTHLLETLHYRGLLRVVRREAGIRIYSARSADAAKLPVAEQDRRLDALIDVIVRTYAPLPAGSLSPLVRRLRWGVPQWQARIRSALARATRRLAQARVGDVVWYWPADESPSGHDGDDRLRLLAPFDPVVWDRRRFELFWGWSYRFEAYTPVAKRKLGYYALPLLWQERVVGWANANLRDGALSVTTGFVGDRAPRDRRFKRALEEEVDRLREFLRSEE